MEVQAPDALEWSVENCTIAKTLAILGEKWTFIVLRDVFLGIRRFDDFIEHTGIPARCWPTGSARWSSRACCGGTPIATRVPGPGRNTG